MGLPTVGVIAEVKNIEGYKSAIRTLNTANESAGASVNHLSNIFDVALGGVVSNVVRGVVNLASQGATAIINFAGASIDAAREGAEAQRQLNAVLTSTKGIAGVTAADVNNLAAKYSNLTKYSDNEIVSAQNLLLTFTRIGKKTFPDTTKAVLDMAAGMHMDLHAAALAVGKAMNDPVAGVTSLQREGVKLTASQKNLVAQMVRVGNTAGAQKVILQELATEFGGSAAAAATPWDLLQNKIQAFQEAIGGVLTPIFDSLASAINPLIDHYMPMLTDLLTNQVGPAVSTAITVFGDFFTNLSQGETPMAALGKALAESGVPPDVTQSVEDLAKGVIDFIQGVPAAVDGIGKFVDGASGLADVASDAFDVASGASDINDKLVPMFESGGKFGKFGDEVRDGFQTAIAPVVKLVAQFVELNKQIGAVQLAKDLLSGKAETGGSATPAQTPTGVGVNALPAPGKSTLVGQTADVQAKIVPPTAADTTASASVIQTALQNSIPPINIDKQVTTGVTNAVDAGKTTAIGISADLGKSVTTGIAGGITSGQGAVSGAVVDVVMKAIAAGKVAADAHSPSRVFAQLGKWMMQGLSMGIDDNANLATRATQSAVASTIMAAIQPQAMAISGNTTNNSTNINDSRSNTNIYNLGVSPYQSQGSQTGNALAMFSS